MLRLRWRRINIIMGMRVSITLVVLTILLMTVTL
jgi:hypothetical protein